MANTNNPNVVNLPLTKLEENTLLRLIATANGSKLLSRADANVGAYLIERIARILDPL